MESIFRAKYRYYNWLDAFFAQILMVDTFNLCRAILSEIFRQAANLSEIAMGYMPEQRYVQSLSAL